MAGFRKVISFFLLTTAAIVTATDDFSSSAGVVTTSAGDLRSKIELIEAALGKRGPAQSIQVNYPAAAMTPILYTSPDYQGPYDPFDPKGKNAAFHRAMKMRFDLDKENALSYIPPDLGKYAKKELIKFAVGEGQRFAVAHPKETADLVGIFTKIKKLYQTALGKMAKLEEEETKKAEEN